MATTVSQSQSVILDSINEGVFTVDLDWRITAFNRAAERILGVSREHAVGKPCCEVFRASICENACAPRETLATGRPVGKSTVATCLAVGLARAGRSVGLLDVDVHGPSIPQLLGLWEQTVAVSGNQIQPVNVNANLAVMSIGFLVASHRDAVIWRGPMKYNVIRQFLKDVNWGRLDDLIVDFPIAGADELRRQVKQLIQPRHSPVQTADGVWITGEIPRKNDFEDVGGASSWTRPAPRPIRSSMIRPYISRQGRG
jgi:hypothetical protein